MPTKVLDPELREDLRRLLVDAVAPDKLREAIAAIDFACASAKLEISIDERDPGFSLREQREHHEQSKATAQHAEKLQRMLAVRKPLWDTHNMDWLIFDAALENVRRSAAIEADATKASGRGLGRRLHWRDALISTVFKYCPTDATPKTRSMFKDVVERVLGEVFKHEVENLSEVIAGALKRYPEPPFSVEIIDS